MKPILLALLLAGCAAPRYLTPEQDAQLKADCQPVGGCIYMPEMLWRKIEAVLKGGTAI